MPRRIYHASDPPTFRDHLYSHPWEICVSIFAVIAGLTGMLAPFLGGRISPSISELPWPLVVTFCGLLVGGGSLILSGLFNDSEDLMVGWVRERTGLILMASGWAVYFAVVLYFHPGSIISWGWGICFTSSCLIRLRATFLEERSVREAS